MNLSNYKPVELKNVLIDDNFWNRYQNLVRDEIIPYQWQVINDEIKDENVAPSHAIRNFRIAAGQEDGEYHGYVFQDTDVAKWIEAVAYSLIHNPNPEIEKKVDETIEIIKKAQQDDGYLVTYFIVKEPDKKFTNLLDCHELYSAGHMIEAAVAYYQATNKRTLLDVVCKFVDLIDNKIGSEEGKIHGYSGHPEIELALVKLYRVTDNKNYLNLCKYLIDERGKEPHYFDEELKKRNYINHWNDKELEVDKLYNQSHKPFKEQDVAVGHAVRALYLYSGAADLACETGDEELWDVCDRLFDNVTKKQMYITGGVGSQSYGEQFTFDYHLPPDTAYAETCASIALAFFAHRMLQMKNDKKYSDILEKALYNGIISGMQLDGKHFFYVNPLEVWEAQCKDSRHHYHVKSKRKSWFPCACCPPNLARILTSLGSYIYTVNNDTVYTHLYIGGKANIKIGEQEVEIVQNNNYPWDGNCEFTLSKGDYSLALRIPSWAKQYSLYKNDQEITNYIIENGYTIIKDEFKDGDKIKIIFDMEVRLIESNPKLRENSGKLAIMRGPIVYCVESADNGENLWAIRIDKNSKLSAEYDNKFLGGTIVIKGEVLRKKDWNENELYRDVEENYITHNIKAIPYAFWSNREDTREMKVFINQK